LQLLYDAALAVPAGHRSTIGVEIHCVGFDIADSSVAGYGLVYAEQHRNLRGVCVLEGA